MPDIIQILKETGFISDTAGAVLGNYMQKWQVSGYTALVQTHTHTEPQLADILAEKFKLPRIFQAKHQDVSREALERIPWRKAREWEVLPIGMVGAEQDALEIALADPTEVNKIKEIEKFVQCRLVLAVAERSDIVRAIDLLYPIEMQLLTLK